MHVASALSGDLDPVVLGVAEVAAPRAADSAVRAVLVVGAPGFGKTSVLSASAALVAERLSARIVWIRGGAVASEAHFAGLLRSSAGDVVGGPRSAPPGAGLGAYAVPASRQASVPQVPVLAEALAGLADAAEAPVVLAIDDFDDLIFKRERVAVLLAQTVGANARLRLIGTCRPAAATRLRAPAHPFVRALRAAGLEATSVSITRVDDAAAQVLIQQRAPGLPDAVRRTIVGAAGGHPAALVFLSRVAALQPSADASPEDDENRPHPGCQARHAGSTERAGAACAPGDFVDWAAEFAGAVYAESWADLGPQQRAILWQLSRTSGGASAATLASALGLSAPQVSAQLTRLIADELVLRTERRGRFRLAPLLAGWVGRRAAGGGASALPTGRRTRRPPSGSRVSTSAGVAAVPTRLAASRARAVAPRAPLGAEQGPEAEPTSGAAPPASAGPTASARPHARAHGDPA